MYEKQVTVSQLGWRLSELFHEIQEVSGEAAASWKASGEDLQKLGLMWVVVRYELKLVREICPGEELHFKTWALPFRHMMSQRNYLVTDSNENLVLSAAGIWAVVDRTSRKMVDLSGYPVHFGAETSEYSISRPGSPEKAPVTHTDFYQVREVDLDMNLHMNNTRYFDLVEGHVDERFQGKVLRQIRAAFLNEARLGDTVQLNWGSQDQLQYFSGRKEGAACFEISMIYDAVSRDGSSF